MKMSWLRSTRLLGSRNVQVSFGTKLWMPRSDSSLMILEGLEGSYSPVLDPTKDHQRSMVAIGRVSKLKSGGLQWSSLFFATICLTIHHCPVTGFLLAFYWPSIRSFRPNVSVDLATRFWRYFKASEFIKKTIGDA